MKTFVGVAFENLKQIHRKHKNLEPRLEKHHELQIKRTVQNEKSPWNYKLSLAKKQAVKATQQQI